MGKIPWRKASRSQTGGSQCVEAAKLGAQFGVRDSKLGNNSPVLDMTDTDWSALLTSIKR